jgi:DNA-binding transcriptional LysR family regulator
MMLPDFEAWAIFASVVENRSFSGAAQVLGTSKATVSKAISRLEIRLGATLFHRTSRRLTLTESGQALSDRAARILSEAREAEEIARDANSTPIGRVRLSAPMNFGLTRVAPALADFLTLYPGIEVDLTLSDAPTDIVAQGIDVALRVADLPDSSLRVRRLAPVRLHLVAAPAYLEKHGRPEHPSDLAHHASRPFVWQFRRGNEEVAIRPTGPLSTDSGEAMLPALRAGLGITRLPDFIVEQDLADGTLVELLNDWQETDMALHLLTPPGTLRPARVEALIDFLAERFRQLCATRK